MVQNWATPRAGKTTDEDPQVWAERQARGDVATMPLGAQVKQWGTPQARDHKGASGRAYKGEADDLPNQVERPTNKRLNPRWVAQLMGVPTDWVYPSEQERNRTDELRMLGNGVVPQTAAKAFTTLLADLCRKVIDSGTKQ
jgi:site-specific DNA-cytosine methylase